MRKLLIISLLMIVAMLAGCLTKESDNEEVLASAETTGAVTVAIDGRLLVKSASDSAPKMAFFAPPSGYEYLTQATVTVGDSTFTTDEQGRYSVRDIKLVPGSKSVIIAQKSDKTYRFPVTVAESAQVVQEVISDDSAVYVNEALIKLDEGAPKITVQVFRADSEGFVAETFSEKSENFSSENLTDGTSLLADKISELMKSARDAAETSGADIPDTSDSMISAASIVSAVAGDDAVNKETVKAQSVQKVTEARVQLSSGNVSSAKLLVEEAVALNSKNSEALFYLSCIEFSQEKAKLKDDVDAFFEAYDDDAENAPQRVMKMLSESSVSISGLQTKMNAAITPLGQIIDRLLTVLENNDLNIVAKKAEADALALFDEDEESNSDNNDTAIMDNTEVKAALGVVYLMRGICYFVNVWDFSALNLGYNPEADGRPSLPVMDNGLLNLAKAQSDLNKGLDFAVASIDTVLAMTNTQGRMYEDLEQEDRDGLTEMKTFMTGLKNSMAGETEVTFPSDEDEEPFVVTMNTSKIFAIPEMNFNAYIPEFNGNGAIVDSFGDTIEVFTANGVLPEGIPDKEE